MNPLTIGLLLISLVLSTAAQLLLKVGMGGVTQAPAGGGVVATVLAIALSPWIIAGLAAYVASAGAWLLVLSKLDVSKAYPCVALAFVMTVVAGHYLLGEQVSLLRIVGVSVIVAGVAIVALT